MIDAIEQSSKNKLGEDCHPSLYIWLCHAQAIFSKHQMPVKPTECHVMPTCILNPLPPLPLTYTHHPRPPPPPTCIDPHTTFPHSFYLSKLKNNNSSSLNSREDFDLLNVNYTVNKIIESSFCLVIEL
jgi:hypothetical protein